MAEEPRAEPAAIEQPEKLERPLGNGHGNAGHQQEDVLLLCKDRANELSDGVALAAIRATAQSVSTAQSQGGPLRPDCLVVVLQILEAWRQQSEEIVAEGLQLLEVALAYLLAIRALPPAQTVPLLVARLVACQSTWRAPLLRALAFRTVQQLLVQAGLWHCAGVLAGILEPALAAFASAAAASSDSARFALQVFSLCALAPLAEDPAGLPQLPAGHSDGLLGAAADVLRHAQRDPAAAAAGRWDCGIAGGLPVAVERRHLLAFFTTLPRLQSVLPDGGLAAADSDGDTILHKLAAADLGDCLQAYLRGCSPSLDTSLRNKAGQTAAEVAAAHGREESAAALDGFPASVSSRATTEADAEQAGQPARPLLMQNVARAMARASSVPLPPQGPPSESGSDRQLPSLSWIGPDTATAYLSQDERLKQFEAQAQGRLRTLSKLGSCSSSQLSSNDGSRPPTQRPAGDDRDRQRILELALAGLNAGSSEGGGERAGSERSWASLQNPAAPPLQVNNPFASYSDVQGRLDAQRGQLGLRAPPPQLPVGSYGSVGSADFESRLASLRQASVGSEKAADDAGKAGRRAEDWETAAVPSTRMWLGNIAAHVTVRSLYEVFGHFGHVSDAAVFPARIGPLGYAFVNFSNLAEAKQAHDALNNTSVPPLTGSKLLKIRYKPAQQQKPPVQDGLENIGQHPSNHLWLGNLPTRPNKLAIEELFCQFGPLTSVRVFPGKTFAFVNFDSPLHAATAMRYLDGKVWPAVSGTKPMVVRYQAGPALAPPLDLRLPGLQGAPGLLGLPARPPSAVGLPQHLHALGAQSLVGPAPLHGLPGGLDQLQRQEPPQAPSLPILQAQLQSSGLDLEALLPAINLSNRLNPNNMHYDRGLAELYKNMTKAEKEALWADDRSQQQLLGMGKDQLPADLSLLGLPPQQAALLSNHMASGGSMGPWGSASLPPAALGNAWAASAGLHSQAPAGLPGLGQLNPQGQASTGFAPPASAALLQQLLASQHMPQASLAEAFSSLGVQGR